MTTLVLIGGVFALLVLAGWLLLRRERRLANELLRANALEAERAARRKGDAMPRPTPEELKRRFDDGTF